MGRIYIDSVEDIQEDDVRNTILNMMRKVVNLSYCREFANVFIEELAELYAMTDDEKRDAELKISQHLDKKIKSMLKGVLAVLLIHGYVILDVDKFIDSVDEYLSKYSSGEQNDEYMG